jgi:hypothetical protein
MHKQFIFSIKDLRFVTISCTNCKTRVTMDLQIECKSPERAEFPPPSACPRCRNPFDSAVSPAIESLQGVYRSLAGLASTVSFTGEAEAEAIARPQSS